VAIIVDSNSPNCLLVDYIYLMSVQTVDWLIFI
jgi:hypothetical protein